MPDTNDGPAGTVTDTAAPSSDSANSPLPGFAEAMTGFGPPDPSAGEPESAKAVETSEVEKAPASDAEKPKAETPEAPAKDEAKPAPTQTVNFDGFSDQQKTTWERLLKAGQVTPAEVETARLESMFQASWSRAHGKLAKEREAFLADKAKVEEDLKLLATVRSDPKRHDAFLRASSDEFAADESAEDPVGATKVAEIARKAIEQREAEKADRSAKEQAKYDAAMGEMQTAVREQMRMLGVKPDVMKGYLEAEEATLNGADPITHFKPSELMYRVQLRHDAATARAEAAALKEQLTQRASKQVQASKQSLPPARRVADDRPMDVMSKTLADLGVAQWGDVLGSGFHNGQH